MTISAHANSYIQARHYHRGRVRPIGLVVIHDMEAPELATTAESVARYFQTTDRPASAHYNVDSDSIVCSVQEQDTAFHARGVNADGIGIEHAGYARQTTEQWLDLYGVAMLTRSAKLTADLCARYSIPVRFVDAAGLKRGDRGITTHKAASDAFNPGGHHDPGPNFPMDLYLAWVNQAMKGADMSFFIFSSTTDHQVDLYGGPKTTQILDGEDLKRLQERFGPVIELTPELANRLRAQK